VGRWQGRAIDQYLAIVRISLRRVPFKRLGSLMGLKNKASAA